MLDLAIAIDETRDGTTIIETNHGQRYVATEWPQDCEFQLISFRAKRKVCEVVQPEELSKDIAEALATLKLLNDKVLLRSDWYRRLHAYCDGIKENSLIA